MSDDIYLTLRNGRVAEMPLQVTCWIPYLLHSTLVHTILLISGSRDCVMCPISGWNIRNTNHCISGKFNTSDLNGNLTI